MAEYAKHSNLSSFHTKRIEQLRLPSIPFVVLEQTVGHLLRVLRDL
jgi:hypothetical protein